MALSWGTPTPAITRVVQMEPGPTPILTASAPALIRSRAPVGGGHVAGDELDLGKIALGVGHRLHHPVGVAVGRVDHDDVHPGVEQDADPLFLVRAHPDGGPDPQAAEFVLAGPGIFADLFDILDGDEAVQLAVVIHHQQFFDAVFMEQGLGLLQGDAHLGGDQALLGHHLFDLIIQVGFEAQVPVGDDAHQFAPIHHRNPGDAVALHQLQDVGDAGLRPDGHRVDDHPGLRFFHLFDFQGLGRRGHITVQDADAPLASHGDGGVRLGDGVHGGTEQRDISG